jgi:hypothetical protein
MAEQEAELAVLAEIAEIEVGGKLTSLLVPAKEITLRRPYGTP